MATEAMQIANLSFYSADISDLRATMILSANVSTRTKIYHQNYLSLLGKRQGGNEDFQDKEINRDQNDTVVNLSSKDLKPAESPIVPKIYLISNQCFVVLT
jgi:hypothetical protein